MPEPTEADAAPASGAALAQWLQWLESRDPSRIELGLDRVRRVLRRMALPPRLCPLITVAGTNGKGSVVANIDALAGAAGLRVGAYLSPHLTRFNERIRVNGDDVEDTPLVSAFEQVAVAEQGDALTYFEFTTLAAIALLQAAELDLWVLEVGLGGRLDAVNVLDADLVVLTSIGLDHTDWLGETLADIAQEKLGVIRAGVPLVCGVTPDADPAVLDTINKAVATLSVDCWQLGREIKVDANGAEAEWGASIASVHYAQLPPLRLAGTVQRGNAALALAALQRLGIDLPSDLIAAFDGVRLPGRCQRVAREPTVVVDTAHNVEAAAALAQALGHHHQTGAGPTHAVLGMLQGKPVAGVVQALSSVVDVWHFCGLPGPRGLSAPAVLQASGAQGQVHESVGSGLQSAREGAGMKGCVLATGSFLTVEAVIKSLPMTLQTTETRQP